MHGDEEPDREFGRGVRFGCGFVFGLVILGLSLLTRYGGGYWEYAVGGAVVIGLLSMYFGDRLWEWIAKIGYWWH